MKRIDIVKICIQCKKEFITKPWILHRSNRRGRFCSKVCQGKYLSEVLWKNEEYRKKHNTFKKGNKFYLLSSGNKGKKFLETSIRMMGNKNALGHKHSEEAKRKMSELHKGKSLSFNTKEKIRKKLLGKSYLSLEVRRRMSEKMMGENNHWWHGGISVLNKSERQLAMNTIEYKLWRKSVFEHDDYTCQVCGEKGGVLNADHIKSWAEYPELRFEVSNGRTLCIGCHRKTKSYGNRNKVYGLSRNKENYSMGGLYGQ